MQYVFYAWRLFFVFADCLEIVFRLCRLLGDCFSSLQNAWSTRVEYGKEVMSSDLTKQISNDEFKKAYGGAV